MSIARAASRVADHAVPDFALFPHDSQSEIQIAVEHHIGHDMSSRRLNGRRAQIDSEIEAGDASVHDRDVSTINSLHSDRQGVRITRSVESLSVQVKRDVIAFNHHGGSARVGQTQVICQFVCSGSRNPKRQGIDR